MIITSNIKCMNKIIMMNLFSFQESDIFDIKKEKQLISIYLLIKQKQNCL